MLGIRLDPDFEHRLDAVARRQGRSKSALARDALRRYVEAEDEAFVAEARRQSLRAAARAPQEEDGFWESVSSWDDRPS